jgi:hypothetical protein
MSRSVKGRWFRGASALTLVAGIVLVVMSTVAFAQDDNTGGGGVQADEVSTQTVDLHNNTAEVGTDCPEDTSVAYWHFVIAPNDGTYAFVTIHLNLNGTTFDFPGDGDIILNGGQLDNVFIAVPDGYALTDLETSGSSADISPDSPPPTQFNLSHICPASEVTTTTEATTTTTEVSPTTVVESTTTTEVKAAAVTQTPLAFTGANSMSLPMAIAGGVLVLAGLAMVFYAQRRFA